MSESPYQSSQPQYGYGEPQQQAPNGGYPPAAPPAYGGNGYGYNQSAADANSAATLSLVFGILGVVLLPILAPFALWQASKAEKLGKSATAGKVLGWIGVVFLAVGVVFFLLFLIGLAASGGGY
ncbi:DUF4190 domain-containing protein [Georgenia thermotolerans]|uniref:DUF4190 domain-containing protein n=1 Tax=Georgenia thermotolerans TaxID=527326 RepID=UPI001B8B9F72|nr:DUF4190 domain-containing protein [Georgenia thermotolerans]